jgi:hypothetical protein
MTVYSLAALHTNQKHTHTFKPSIRKITSGITNFTLEEDECTDQIGANNKKRKAAR